MAHNHAHNSENVSGKRLLVTMALNFLITIAEIVGGTISGSLSLISDALHNFSDGIAIIISYVAIKAKRKPRSQKHTYGYERSEILAAFINSATLLVISFYLFYEAVLRFIQPVEIAAELMTLVASAGLFANVIGTVLLKKGAKNNLNIRSAYLHLLGDAISSFAVIVGGLAIYFFNVYWLDPVLTFVISAYILKESYSILKNAVHILMQGTPENISPEKIKKEIEKLDGVIDVHHVHVWALGENDVHLEAHIKIKEMLVSEGDDLRKKIESVLRRSFNISHSTLQLEKKDCETRELVAKN